MTPTHRNRLARETSPYLRQHQDNPVDWYPWGEEAFAAARERDVPLLLSVGYSTCHWCHVMAHESFENEQIAAFMNAHFVNVKIDREERPDVDGIYMSAVQAMTGAGGWPMTVFALPSGEPFYAGTYFPPQDMRGLPGFPRLLSSIAAAWREQREKLLGNAQAITAHLREQQPGGRGEAELPADFLERGVQNLQRVYDVRHGGFGGAPKFPAPTTLSFLLTQPGGAEMALDTLEKMGRGGIYDQLGGGWHRYSVDERWLVPHFEKMLYDNAQLARTLLQAYQLSHDASFLRLARETLAYLEREMLGPEGGFYSAQDADQEGIEGKFFVWTPQELEVLGRDAELVGQYYGVTEEGNFLDPHHPEFGRRSVLSVPRPLKVLAAERGEDTADLEHRVAQARQTLFELRRERAAPGTDDKVLTSWNGLALQAFAEAARVTGEAHYLEIARRNAAFVWDKLRDEGGGLRHTYKDGVARVRGLLEDQALYGLGLVALYQAGGDLAHLRWARELWQHVQANFWDEAAGLFYSTGGAAEPLLTRQAQAFDSAVMSDNAAAALLGMWMSRYFSEEVEGERLARRAVQTFSAEMLAAAGGFGGLWQAAAFLQAPHSEIALLGTPAERAALEAEVARHFLPFTALAPGEAGGELEVLHQRGGAGVAYVCLERVCDLPTSDLGVLAQQLARLSQPQES
ncbi:thioredoxin domain-containing protein [Deinococcus irradiatisoli]|uniref:Thioredoxin domain-containing protein n=1 Tax=Deinococcus irradiatisoli TaxID=2202254 RepID=A0A2Z3JM61_9DEIO|nr:thioredoxin domain-containing protein [Deinococcus irradiatisoli]AWN23889.1 thioredoxin domain-containing protein [Deinococcus irradiatisoli]